MSWFIYLRWIPLTYIHAPVGYREAFRMLSPRKLTGTLPYVVRKYVRQKVNIGIGTKILLKAKYFGRKRHFLDTLRDVKHICVYHFSSCVRCRPSQSRKSLFLRFSSEILHAAACGLGFAGWWVEQKRQSVSVVKVTFRAPFVTLNHDVCSIFSAAFDGNGPVVVGASF